MRHSQPRSFSATFPGVIVTYLFKRFTPQRRALKAYARAESIKPFDALVVPGVPFKNDTWDSVMKARVLWSYVLYKNGYARNIIYTGAAVYSPYVEAVVMGLYAQQLGIPKDNIFYETAARHSTENIYYSYLLAKRLGFKTLALATDSFQSFMLWRFTRRRFGSRIYHLPIVANVLEKYNSLDPVIDPAAAFVQDFKPITDEETVWQRICGTLGWDISWHGHANGRLEPL